MHSILADNSCSKNVLDRKLVFRLRCIRGKYAWPRLIPSLSEPNMCICADEILSWSSRFYSSLARIGKSDLLNRLELRELT